MAAVMRSISSRRWPRSLYTGRTMLTSYSSSGMGVEGTFQARSGGNHQRAVAFPPVPETPLARRLSRSSAARVLIAATVAWGLLLAVWSVAMPLGEAPDEPAHLGLVLHLAAGQGYPEFDELQSPA